MLRYLAYFDKVNNVSDSLFERLFPQRVLKECGKDRVKLEAFYRKNMEALRPASEGMGFDVDPDVIEVGGSNRKNELLERCVKMLEEGDRSELALRLLKRYTTEGLSAAAEWRRWLDRNRDRLFFTDRGGFKFIIDPSKNAGGERTAAAHAQEEPVEKLSKVASVSLSVTLDPTLRIHGTVRDARTGRPIERSRVIVGEKRLWDFHWQVDSPREFASGAYEYTNESATTEHALRFEAEGYKTLTSRRLLPNEGAVVLDVELEPGSRPAGVVRTPEGSPAADAEVFLCASGEQGSYAFIDGKPKRSSRARTIG